MHLTGGDTFASQSSRRDESWDFEDEYHEPAWLAFRIDIVLAV